MAMSSGAQRAITEALLWASAGVVLLGAAYHQSEIRTRLGLKFEPAQHKAAPASSSDVEPAANRNAPPPAAASTPANSVRVRADTYGHFNARAYINGDPIDVLVDTGATMVALTWEDARAAGLHVRESDFTLRSSTANGIALFAPATLSSVRIGDITVHDVRAAVAKRGQLQRTLLGMSFLGQVRVEMRDREMILSR
jgi:aspartyl protease family protein